MAQTDFVGLCLNLIASDTISVAAVAATCIVVVVVVVVVEKNENPSQK